MEKNLEIRLFGRFHISLDGQSLEIPKKAQALLAYLAVGQGRKFTREQLATLLWSEHNEERSRHNLRQALAKIRQQCHTLILSKGDFVWLNQQQANIDVIDFTSLAKSKDAQDLQRCLKLYSGEFLDGLLVREQNFEDWLMLTRSHLRELACTCSNKLITLLDQEKRYEDLMQLLQHRLTMDPCYEPAHVKLMWLFDHFGRRSDALRQYQICAQNLQRELGVKPGKETEEMLQRIKLGETGISKDLAVPVMETSLTRETPRVAVLPFESLTANNESYFVDGIVEDLIIALSRFSNLEVIARASTFLYRDKGISQQQIAQELDAHFLVCGSVQTSGSRIRIKVQLTDAKTGINLWGERFDREMADIFLLQDEISATLVSLLVGQMEAARLAKARKAPPERLDAYDMLLRGKEHHHRFTADDCKMCIDLFSKAIEMDPDYAVAHAWLACGLGQAMVFELDDIEKLVDKSQAAALRGLELDENESECHRLLAQIYLTRADLKRSLWHQERALSLNPNDEQSVCSMGEILSYVGRHGEAERWVRRSMQLNPYHPQRYWTHLARPLLHLQRYAECIAALDHISRLRKDDYVYYLAACSLLEKSQLWDAAWSRMNRDFPKISIMDIAGSLPYENSSDRQFIQQALSNRLPID